VTGAARLHTSGLPGLVRRPDVSSRVFGRREPWRCAIREVRRLPQLGAGRRSQHVRRALRRDGTGSVSLVSYRAEIDPIPHCLRDSIRALPHSFPRSSMPSGLPRPGHYQVGWAYFFVRCCAGTCAAMYAFSSSVKTGFGPLGRLRLVLAC
jgi:hypothetical protein